MKKNLIKTINSYSSMGDMKVYFSNKRKEQISRLDLHSYLAYMAGLVSLVFSFFKAKHAELMTGIFFGLAAIVEVVQICKQARENHAINLYNVLRLAVSIAICIIAFTCFDKIFG